MFGGLLQNGLLKPGIHAVTLLLEVLQDPQPWMEIEMDALAVLLDVARNKLTIQIHAMNGFCNVYIIGLILILETMPNVKCTN